MVKSATMWNSNCAASRRERQIDHLIKETYRPRMGSLLTLVHKLPSRLLTRIGSDERRNEDGMNLDRSECIGGVTSRVVPRPC